MKYFYLIQLINIFNVKQKSVIDILHEQRIFPIATSVNIEHSVFYYQPQIESSKINDNRLLYIDQKMNI